MKRFEVGSCDPYFTQPQDEPYNRVPRAVKRRRIERENRTFIKHIAVDINLFSLIMSTRMPIEGCCPNANF